MATDVNISGVSQNAYEPLLTQISSVQMNQDQVLRSIEHSLRTLSTELNDPFGSQSSYRDRTEQYNHRDRYSRARRRTDNDFDDEIDFTRDPNGRQRSKKFSKQLDDFMSAFEDELMEGLSGASLDDRMKAIVAEFANDLGVNVADLGKELGQQVGKTLTDAIKETDFGKELSSELTNAKDKFSSSLEGGLKGFADAIKETGSLTDAIRGFGQGSGIAGTLAQFGEAFASGGVSNLAATVLEFGVNLARANYAILALAAATYVIDKFSEALAPAVEGTKKFIDALKVSANREQEEAKKRQENAKERLKKDFNEIYSRPFKILEKAANEAYSVWENVLKQINQTQGYDKEGLQDLWSNYARRLQEEGLDSVVSSADIMTNLSNVLKSGMSGAIAEEFAYMATVLNNAIPTQEFFNYASAYASIAANAIKNGKSQTDAIAEANSELEQFASNLLYSNRQLAGGFSTGLANAENLFASAAKIANASHTGDVSDISGVLTSVSAIVGAIAPDLTSSIVQKIADAATGGNSSELVALRSLAGTGASNTSFLQALAKDPKGVFIEMFSNLAEMQNMYGDNYMEVAEGLSKTFGLSIDEMSQIDFGYLAQAISAMDLNSASLADNLALLGSGESTYSAEQLRMQQINKYMIDEGLSYVLDNEVARAIQEHMWEEQLANQLMENEYAVNLQGAALDFLQGIQFTIDNIGILLNPFGWMRKVESLIATVDEAMDIKDDIKALLEAGKVGSGNAATLYNLTKTGTDLKLTKNYLELLGGHSAYSAAATRYQTGKLLAGSTIAASDTLKGLVQASIIGSRTPSASNASSQYSWSTIGKSITQTLFTTGNKALYNSGSAYADLNLDSAQSKITSRAAQTMQNYLDTMQSFVDEGKTFDEWKASASEYGIEDLDTALQDYGLSEVVAKGKYGEMEAVKAAMYQHERDMKEEQFWDDMIKWCEEDFPAYQEAIYQYNEDILTREDLLLNDTAVMIGELKDSNKQLKEFYNQWIDYYVNHTAYHRDTLNAHDIEAIKYAEAGETGDAVFALAQALTDNLVNLQDPQVQTNALLSQILLVAEAIFQIENNTTTVSLPTALSSLGLGVTSVENQY